MPIAAATPAALGSPRSTSTPKTSPTATVRIWPGPPPGQRAATLAGTEAVARAPLTCAPLVLRRLPCSLGPRPRGRQPSDLRAVPVVAHVGAPLPGLDRADQAATRRARPPTSTRPRVAGPIGRRARRGQSRRSARAPPSPPSSASRRPVPEERLGPFGRGTPPRATPRRRRRGDSGSPSPMPLDLSAVAPRRPPSPVPDAADRAAPPPPPAAATAAAGPGPGASGHEPGVAERAQVPR